MLNYVRMWSVEHWNYYCFGPYSPHGHGSIELLRAMVVTPLVCDCVKVNVVRMSLCHVFVCMFACASIFVLISVSVCTVWCVCVCVLDCMFLCAPGWCVGYNPTKIANIKLSLEWQTGRQSPGYPALEIRGQLLLYQYFMHRSLCGGSCQTMGPGLLSNRFIQLM